jgi:hypothetical protein
MDPEKRIKELGLSMPQFQGSDYYGKDYGKMIPFYRVGDILFLSGHTPHNLIDGTIVNPGRIGAELSVADGYEAARITGINVIAGIKQAIGDLNKVVGLVRTLNFVVCAPEFHHPNKVADGLTDLLADVFGSERGIGPRATIGVTSLANNHCFETWATVHVT